VSTELLCLGGRGAIPSLTDLLSGMIDFKPLRAWLRKNKTGYKEYLHSEHWQQMRKKVYESRKAECQKCQGRKTLEIHHLTYERIGHESLDDLLILCGKCHEKEHAIFDKKKSVCCGVRLIRINKNFRKCPKCGKRNTKKLRRKMLAIYRDREYANMKGTIDLNVGNKSKCKIIAGDPFDLSDSLAA
jgi:hypothetical protein